MNSINRLNLMLDIETTGTGPGCGILSIALVQFGTFQMENKPFYVRILPESNAQIGLKASQETLQWWEKQSEIARQEAFGGTTPITKALEDMSLYIRLQGADPIIWGNGANFDEPIISFALHSARIKSPWKYYNTRCYRTLKNLAPHIPFMEPAVKHNAYQDAKAQANHAERILKWLAQNPIK